MSSQSAGAGKKKEEEMRGVLVMGIGNALRGDDAAGIHVVRRLAREHIHGITLLEHPGDGADLLTTWDGWGHVIVIDAMRSGAAPGSIRRFSIPGDSVPVRCFQTGSTHAIGLGEAIELGQHTGGLPERLVVYGIEGEKFCLGSGMTAVVASQVRRIAEMVAAEAGALMNAGSKPADHHSRTPSSRQ